MDDLCRFFAGDLKLHYAAHFSYYPDVLVTCDPRDRGNDSIKRFPKFVVEVTSPSTSEFDREQKFKDYRCLEALEESV